MAMKKVNERGTHTDSRVQSDKSEISRCFSEEFEAAEVLASLANKKITSEVNVSVPCSNEKINSLKTLQQNEKNTLSGLKMKFPMKVSYLFITMSFRNHCVSMYLTSVSLSYFHS